MNTYECLKSLDENKKTRMYLTKREIGEVEKQRRMQFLEKGIRNEVANLLVKEGVLWGDIMTWAHGGKKLWLNLLRIPGVGPKRADHVILRFNRWINEVRDMDTD